MKKKGIINSDIATVLAHMGHTDTMVVADSGLPIPDQVKKIDLSYQPGKPSFLSILDAVMDDMHVEAVVLAEEIKTHNPALYRKITSRFDQVNFVDHETFKSKTRSAKAVIRTGEQTPFANVILHAGVPFGGDDS